MNVGNAYVRQEIQPGLWLALKCQHFCLYKLTTPPTTLGQECYLPILSTGIQEKYRLNKRSGLQGQIAMTQSKSRNAEIGYWWVLLYKSSAAIQLFLPDTLWALPKGLPFRSCLAHGKSGGWSGKTSCVFISSQSEGRRVGRGGQRHGWSFRKFHFRIYWYCCGGFSLRVNGISDRLYL